MQIVENTPDRLILQDRPLVLGIILILVILLMVFLGLAMLADAPGMAAMLLLGAALFGLAFSVFVRRTRAIFDRPTGLFMLQDTTVWGTQETTHPLAHLARANLQSTTSRSSKGRTTMLYRPVLILTEGEPLPLHQVYVGGRGSARTVQALTDWLG